MYKMITTYIFDKIIYSIHIFSYLIPPLVKDVAYPSEVYQFLLYANFFLLL